MSKYPVPASSIADSKIGRKRDAILLVAQLRLRPSFAQAQLFPETVLDAQQPCLACSGTRTP